jgi:hypothetical protein
VYSKQPAFLQMMYTLNEKKLLSLFPEIDINDVRSHLEAFEQISKGNSDAGPIAVLDMASRFRWLTAKRSTVVQTSAVHSGLCKDAAQTITHLHQQLVLT